MTKKQRGTCSEILYHYGNKNQILKAAQECSELCTALLQYAEGRKSFAEVITEIADAQIMAEQMAELFGQEAVAREIDRKLERQMKRIADEAIRRMRGGGDGG